MSSTGVILYGPPGSGKDTVTAELARLRPEYTLFQRLKAGPGRTAGYRLTTPEHIWELERAGELLYRNARYDAVYAIDRGGVRELFEAGKIPVLHMGQVVGVPAVEAYPATWVRVLLWCPQEVTQARCTARGDRDVEARLKAWAETRQDLHENAETRWSLLIQTDQQSPTETAKAIDHAATTGAHEPLHSVAREIP